MDVCQSLYTLDGALLPYLRVRDALALSATNTMFARLRETTLRTRVQIRIPPNVSFHETCARVGCLSGLVTHVRFECSESECVNADSANELALVHFATSLKTLAASGLASPQTRVLRVLHLLEVLDVGGAPDDGLEPFNLEDGPSPSLSQITTFRAKNRRLESAHILANWSRLRELQLSLHHADDALVLLSLITSRLSGLEHLSLNGRAFADLTLQTPWACAQSLTYLSIENSNVFDASFIQQLQHLRVLRIKQAPLIHLHPLATLKYLRVLDLMETSVSDVTLLGDSNFHALQQLNIALTFVSDLNFLIGEGVGSKLQSLDVSFSSVADMEASVWARARLANLTHLSMDGTDVEDFGPILMNCPLLRFFSCKQSKAKRLLSNTDDIPAFKLETVICSETNVTSLDAFRHTVSLKSVIASQCSSLTSIRGLLLSRTSLTTLHLSDSKIIKDASEILTQMRSLQFLHVCVQYVAGGLEFLQDLQQLQELRLSMNFIPLTETECNHFFGPIMLLLNLQYFYVHGCSGKVFRNEGLQEDGGIVGPVVKKWLVDRGVEYLDWKLLDLSL
ncbi:hypothetical protein BC830DRAFT_1121844 [Chytriomyces sp. MP71]|nr:hypothetical protein BC830DRAFT_1121844 [Chytriomyces sp. MP71]